MANDTAGNEEVFLKTLYKAHLKRYRNLSEINLTYDKFELAFCRQHVIKSKQ